MILVFETDKGISEKEFIFSGVGWFKHSGFPSPALVNFNYIDFEDIIDFGEGMNFIIKLFIIFIAILCIRLRI